MIRPVLFLVQKELRQIRRDRALLRLVLLVPIVQLFVLGYAANTDLRNVRVSVLDEDRSAASRSLVNAYYASDVFVPGPRVDGPADLQQSLAGGEAEIALWIPRGYQRDVVAGRSATVAIAVDGVNSNQAGRAAGYSAGVVRREAMRLLGEAPQPPAALSGRIRRVESVSRFLYNPELRSRYYMVPGIVVLLITIISALLTGMAVVREREIGTLEQLMVSPLTPAQLIAGKTIPFALIAFFDLAFATLVAVLWFRLPFEGSVFLLGGCAMVYLLVTLGVGLLASTISATQQQAMFVVWFFLVFAILMSGFFYPIENMPGWIQGLTYVNPMRYMMSMVRGIFLRGATLADVGPDLIPLTILGIATFSVAALRFRKRLG